MLPAAAVDGDAVDSHSSTDSSVAVLTQSEGIVIEVAQSSTAINHSYDSSNNRLICTWCSSSESSCISNNYDYSTNNLDYNSNTCM
jgi:hypothetical protein